MCTVYQIRDLEVKVAATIPELDLAVSYCGERVGLPTQSPDTIACMSPLSGRFVRVSRSSTGNYFCVMEIEVFASAITTTNQPSHSYNATTYSTIHPSSTFGAVNVAAGRHVIKQCRCQHPDLKADSSVDVIWGSQSKATFSLWCLYTNIFPLYSVYVYVYVYAYVYIYIYMHVMSHSIRS